MQNTNKFTLESIDSKFRSILIGLLLGDGSIYKPTNTGNGRFEMSFGTNYKQYAEHVVSIFNEFYSQLELREVKIKGKNKTYINYRLKSSSNSLWNAFYELFYHYNSDRNKYVKIVPSNITEYLDAVALSYLIMSDGNYDKGRNRIRIYTNSFTRTEVELLAQAIKERLGIYTGVLKDKKDQWILTIGARELVRTRELCTPHFESSMLYRLGL